MYVSVCLPRVYVDFNPNHPLIPLVDARAAFVGVCRSPPGRPCPRFPPSVRLFLPQVLTDKPDWRRLIEKENPICLGKERQVCQRSTPDQPGKTSMYQTSPVYTSVLHLPVYLL